MTEEMKKYKKPKYTIRVKTGERHLWEIFHKHHYMSDSLASGAVFFTFYLYKDGIEALFGCLGVIPQISKIPSRRITRFVVLPEFQGLGLAGPVINTISQYYYDKGIRLYSATFHPRLGNYQEKSDLWKASANNMKEHQISEDFFEDNLHSGLRDGVAMYRYHYNPETSINKIEFPKYNLIYDVLNLTALKTKRKHNPSEEINKQILDIEHSIKELQEKIYGQDIRIITDRESEETKEKMKALFKRPKRKALTSEERKVAKVKLKEVKE